MGIFDDTPVYALCQVCYPIWSERDTEFIKHAEPDADCEAWDHSRLTGAFSA